VSEWGIKPWEVDKLTTSDLDDIILAEHAEAYIQQEQRNQQQADTKTNLENRQSKRKRIEQAKQENVPGYS